MRFALISSLLLFPLMCLAQSPAPAPDDYSGMYSFLRDGEFVQITVEDGGKVSGFISRYGDTNADKDTFIDQFFESGKLAGNHLSFATKPLHGVWFTFEGTLNRGPGKAMDEESYYVARGTLVRFKTGTDEKTTRESRTVEFKSFPKD
ncbi:MAG TPA: hypothetical protein VFA90_06045 [Terriglobales bacterium]|nr:hypothetical protein [Terriglobales bacterium]